jgi:hypothetical protein
MRQSHQLLGMKVQVGNEAATTAVGNEGAAAGNEAAITAVGIEGSGAGNVAATSAVGNKVAAAGNEAAGRTKQKAAVTVGLGGLFRGHEGGQVSHLTQSLCQEI